MELSMGDHALRDFRIYHDFLQEKNKVMNLTAITDEDDVARLHFLDCAALLKLVPIQDAAVIDVGTGAGFPGVPLKIAEPSIRLTLLDALQKRINFLKELCEKLGWEDTVCLHARSEEAALLPDMRDRFDYAVSRAVARLNVLTELSLPFVKVGGLFVAMKSTDSDEEIREAGHAIKFLGGELEKIQDYTIPGTDIVHRAVLIRKVTKTPKNHPRRFAKIQKNPL